MNVLAGHEQRHFLQNAFNVLVNEGFLRDQQGVQTLEIVQKFHEIIKQPMTKAKLVKKNLNSFCPAGHLILKQQAVIILVLEDSQSKSPALGIPHNKYYHAV